MKGPTTGSHTTLDSQQWPGATLAQPLSRQMPKTPAAGSRHSGKALPALSWSPQSTRQSGCPEPAAAGRAREAALSQISFSPSSSCTQSKEKTETSEELCPGNLQEDNAFSQSSTVLPPSRGQAHPLHAVGKLTLLLRGKQGRTNHFHRLNTTPGLRHQYPS